MGFTTPMAAVVVVALAAMVAMLVDGTPLDTLQPVSYSGWKVLEVQLGAAAAAEGVTAADSPGINLVDLDDAATVHVLSQNRRSGLAELAVAPSELSRVVTHLETHGAPYTTVVDDLGRRIKEFQPNLRAEPDLRGGMTLSRYMTYDEIKAHVEGLQGRYPGKVKVEVAGRSVEGRPIHLITLTDDVANAYITRKPVIFIDGGIHAREWVSPAAVIGVVDSLLQTPQLTAGLEWRIIPLVNPDGYVATWQKDRLWRKNTAKASGGRCMGVDLNRNFGYHWGEEGASSRPCSNVYHGPRAFSEPEAVAVRDAVLKESSRTKAYITFHSYGQMILHPWGYTAQVQRENNNELARVGNGMAKAIKRANQVSYSVGSAAGILYAASGGSDDWAAGVANIPLAYTIELRDRGNGGFILPSNQIKPTVDDAWLAMKTLGEEILSTKGTRPAKYPFRQTGGEQAEEAEAPEPVELSPEEMLQQVQTPGKRNEGAQNTNQGLIHIIQPGERPEVEPVERTEGQESFDQDQESIKQEEEGVNQRPINRNEGQGNSNQPEGINQPVETLNPSPINRNEGQGNLNQGQEGINQPPAGINQPVEALNPDPVIRDQTQGNSNQEQASINQPVETLNPSPVNRNEGQGNLNQGQEGINQPPAGINQPAEALNPDPVIRDQTQGNINQGQESVNQPQAGINQPVETPSQAPVIRDQPPSSINQPVETPNPDPVIRDQAQGNINQGQESVNQPQAGINQPVEALKPDPVIRDQNQEHINQGQEGINQPPSSINQPAETPSQAPVIRDQPPSSINQPVETPNPVIVNRNEGQGDINLGQGNINPPPSSINQAAEMPNPVPVNRDEGQGGSINQGAASRPQRPVIRDQTQGGLIQDSLEAFDSAPGPDGDSNESLSLETLSSPSTSSSPRFRSAYVPRFKPFQSFESLEDSPEALGGGIPRGVRRWEIDGSSEEGVESEE